jgi:hypothetical protein
MWRESNGHGTRFKEKANDQEGKKRKKKKAQRKAFKQLTTWQTQGWDPHERQASLPLFLNPEVQSIKSL